MLSKALSDPFDFRHPETLKNAFSPLTIMMLGAYFNPVDPDPQKVAAGILNFKNHLQIAKAMGASCVGSETGSLMGTPWGYVPKNHQPQTLEKVIDVFRELVAEAEANDTFVAAEGAYNHVAYGPLQIKTLLDRIHNPRLKVIVDLFNFLHVGNHREHLSLLDQCLSLFPDRIIIFHLKDYRIVEGALKQVGLGQGLMDYPAIISRIQHSIPNAWLVFEGVTKADIPASFAYINQLIHKE